MMRLGGGSQAVLPFCMVLGDGFSRAWGSGGRRTLSPQARAERCSDVGARSFATSELAGVEMIGTPANACELGLSQYLYLRKLSNRPLFHGAFLRP